MTALSSRALTHDIEPLFASRWSTKAFSGETINDDLLFKSFAAARWAPSGGNVQPWRFIYSKRDPERWTQFLSLLNERNQVWAANTSALVLLLSKKICQYINIKGSYGLRIFSVRPEAFNGEQILR